MKQIIWATCRIDDFNQVEAPNYITILTSLQSKNILSKARNY
jgi:hypothetical protein